MKGKRTLIIFSGASRQRDFLAPRNQEKSPFGN
jgi:hypothetical protein